MKEADTMALKLSLKKSVFPVEIGEFKFEVDLADDKVKVLEEKTILFLKEVKEFAKNPEKKEKFEELLQDLFDELLGKGAYKKLYNYTKRVDILAELLGELVLGLTSKLPGREGLANALLASKQEKKDK